MSHATFTPASLAPLVRKAAEKARTGQMLSAEIDTILELYALVHFATEFGTVDGIHLTSQDARVLLKHK